MNRQSLRFGLSLVISFQVAVGPVSSAWAQTASRQNTTAQQTQPSIVFHKNAEGTFDIYTRDVGSQGNAYSKVDLGREKVESVSNFSVDGFTRFKLVNPASGKIREARIVSIADLSPEARMKLLLQTQSAKKPIPYLSLLAKYSPNAFIITNSGSTYLVNRPLSKLTARLENLRLDLSSPLIKQTIFSKALKTMARWNPYLERSAEKRRIQDLEDKIAPETAKQRKAERLQKVRTAVAPATGAMHTVVVIGVLSVIGLVQAKLHEAKLQGKSVNLKELTELSADAALQVVNDPDIYMGMIGSHLVGKVSKTLGIDQKIGRAIENTVVGKATPAEFAARNAAEAARARAARIPNAIIAKILQSPVSRQLFARLLGSVAHSTITFLGWEAGGQLWDEARDMLETKEEQAAASNLFPLLWRSATNSNLGGPAAANSGAMCSTVFTPEAAQTITIPTGMTPTEDQLMAPPAPLKAEGIACKTPPLTFNRMVMSKMATNLGQILLVDSELRDYWFYNTWRRRIASGDFAMLITCMSTAGVLGTAIFPGVGTFAGIALGFASGIVGGLLSHAIPQPLKDGITLGIKNGREGWNQVGLRLDEKVLQLTKDPNSKVGPLFDKITEWNVEKKVDTAMMAPILGPIAQSIGTPGAIGAGVAQSLAALYTRNSWATPEYKEQLRKKYAPTFDTRLADRRELRENLLTIYFEAVHLLKLRIATADQENAIATQTIERQKSDPEFNSYMGRFSRGLKTVAKAALIPAGIGLNMVQPLSIGIRQNEAIKKASTIGLKFYLKKIRDFYKTELQVMQELVDGPHKTIDTIDSLDNAQYGLQVLNEYIQNWVTIAATANFSQPTQQVPVGGVMKTEVASENVLALSPDVQNASTAMEQADRYGFREQTLMTAIDKAKNEGIDIFGLSEDGTAPTEFTLDNANEQVKEEIREIIKQNGGEMPTPEQIAELTNALEAAGIKFVATPGMSEEPTTEDME